eukprot:CAMPEP_0116043494 /NCGR_PEP_ID=MMETSP0321-20121206/26402_1 /TAXON_ID=163516 /ORGANISM="Leptocylindrus danicus var. danicus, Strain B650" /LENGTH=156 /DNA_ID=CAMNT_0003524339 /DNA_START=121 /DNA_END=588 /DNA_ORIENTATION=+
MKAMKAIFALIIFASSCAISCYATNVKWTPNQDDKFKDTDAANAPRSQKYWDEHNIERPDYALSDDEYAEKYGKTTMKSLFFKTAGALKWVILIAFAVKLGFPWIQRQYTDLLGFKSASIGGRLGGNKIDVVSTEDTRRARLARFEAAAASEEEPS